MNNRITVGTEIIAKIGRNEVEAIITEASDTILKAKSKRSGKEFTVTTIVKVLTPEAPVVEPAPIQAEAPVALTTEQSAKKLSLLKAAFQVLNAAGCAMNVKEILAKVQEENLWMPMEGKTPENTLYAAILREINTKESPMFKRCDSRKGAFESAC